VSCEALNVFPEVPELVVISAPAPDAPMPDLVMSAVMTPADARAHSASPAALRSMVKLCPTAIDETAAFAERACWGCDFLL
jgi:hypothetical protein